MTREEAILHMTLRRTELEHSVSDLDEDIKAFDMAIKALEQEPCDYYDYEAKTCRRAEPCEDAISFPKGTLKKRGKGYVVYNPEWLKENWQTELKVMGIECEDCISRAGETMQVELEGDGYSDGELVYDYGKCPKCGWQFEYGEKDWEEPYCCHCGQKLHWFESEE